MSQAYFILTPTRLIETKPGGPELEWHKLNLNLILGRLGGSGS